jgi:hypothetical protein
MTQPEKIIELCKDGVWHCQNEFHPITWSPHKRRGEIEQKGKYLFEPRPCEHGIPQSKDFLMKPNPLYQATPLTPTKLMPNEYFMPKVEKRMVNTLF